MFTKEESRKKIQELTENFEEKLDFIKTSGQYKEVQIEDEFIKPLFRYLNCNILNEGIKNQSLVRGKSSAGKKYFITEIKYLLKIMTEFYKINEEEIEAEREKLSDL